MVLKVQTWRIRQRRVALAGCKGSPPRLQSGRRWSGTGGPACCLPVHQTSAGSLLQQGCRSGPVWPQMQDLHAAAVRCCTASVLACSDQPQLKLGPADQPEAAALAQDCSAQRWSRYQGCMHAAGPAAPRCTQGGAWRVWHHAGPSQRTYNGSIGCARAAPGNTHGAAVEHRNGAIRQQDGVRHDAGDARVLRHPGQGGHAEVQQEGGGCGCGARPCIVGGASHSQDLRPESG